MTRNVKTLHIRNKHASTSTDVMVVFDQNGTDFELWQVNLAPGSSWSTWRVSGSPR
jgi:hypothetical protein